MTTAIAPPPPGARRAAAPPPTLPPRPPVLPEIRHWPGPGVPRLDDLARRLESRGLTAARCTAPAASAVPWRDAGSGTVLWLCSGWLGVEWEDPAPSGAAGRPAASLRLGPGDRLTLPPGTRFRFRVESDVPAWYVIGRECELADGP